MFCCFAKYLNIFNDNVEWQWKRVVGGSANALHTSGIFGVHLIQAVFKGIENESESEFTVF